jgi:hypothetical protein
MVASVHEIAEALYAFAPEQPPEDRSANVLADGSLRCTA